MTDKLTVPPNNRAKLGEILLHISDDILSAVNHELMKYEISESKFALLLRLYERRETGICKPSELANILGIRRASVTKQLISLENQGLITRKTNDIDKREVNVTITDKGYALFHNSIFTYWQTCSKLVEKLNDDEVNLMIKLTLKTEI